MRIKADITALGELLIDFTPAGVSQQGMRLFEQNPGGARPTCWQLLLSLD